MLEFILREMPLGIIVFDEKMGIMFRNANGEKFLKRYGILAELITVAGKILNERHSAATKTLSKDIFFSGTGKNIPVNLSVRYLYSQEPKPRISVFIFIKPCNGQLNVEEVISRYNLTNKESEIFRELVTGAKNADIARKLNIKEHTVRDHLRNIYTKCGVRNKLELVRNIIT